MPTPRNAMTARERQLSDELNRIRSTYSFNLGLLLTEALFRKPWKIPLLPLSFILFNIRYIKQRRVKKLHIEENSIELDENVLMLISTTEEGTASLERCAILATEWLNEPERKVVIVSPHEDHPGFLPKKAVMYPIKDPKLLHKQKRSEWNALCENLISNILESHRPQHAIFDGPYPYRGVLNSIKSFPSATWVWFRPEGIDNSTLLTQSEHFTKTERFSISDRPGVAMHEPKGLPVKKEWKRVLLDARTYGSHTMKHDMKMHNIYSELGNDIAVVHPYDANAVGGEITSVLSEQSLDHLMGAVVPANLEIVAATMAANLPTLCIYTDDTNPATLADLRKGSARCPVMFCHERDTVQIMHCLTTLVRDNNAMRESSSSVKKRNWVSQIIPSFHKD